MMEARYKNEDGEFRVKGMTGEDLFKYSWKAMEVVEFHNPRTNKVIQCALLAIDFDFHSMKLVPLADLGYEQKEFWIGIDLVRKIPKKTKDGAAKMKLT